MASLSGRTTTRLPARVSANSGRHLSAPWVSAARHAVWRGVNDLDQDLYHLHGDLAAVHAMSLELTERHSSTLGTVADGMLHCSTRALDTLREVRELHARLHEAAAVVRENDSTRLSGDALRARFEPGPHRDPA